MAAAVDALDAVLRKVRAHLSARGVRGTHALEEAFAAFDADGSGALDRKEFDDALRCTGIFLSKQEVGLLFRALDAAGDLTSKGTTGLLDGRVEVAEFVRLLREEVSEARQDAIARAFHQLDPEGAGRVGAAEVEAAFRAGAHPDVVSGRRSEDAVRAELGDGLGLRRGASVSWERFRAFYEEVATTFPSDVLFVDFMAKLWGLVVHVSASDASKVTVVNPADVFEGHVRELIERRCARGDSEERALQRHLRHFAMGRFGEGVMTLDEFAEAVKHLPLEAPRATLEAVFAEHGVAPHRRLLHINDYARHVFAPLAAACTRGSIL